MMSGALRTSLDDALAWCAAALGPASVVTDYSKAHGGHESVTCRVQTPAGLCYLKVHSSRSHWENEVHAYEQWAPVFGSFAPKLLAVRDEEPLALVVGELPGKIVEHAPLSRPQEQAIWRAAGAALVGGDEEEDLLVEVLVALGLCRSLLGDTVAFLGQLDGDGLVLAGGLLET